MGQIEGNIIKQCRQSREPIPDKILNKPMPLIGEALYMDAFFDLSGSRQMGMTPGPIPWHRVQQYAQMMGFDDDQCFTLHHVVRFMDAVYLAHIGK